MLFVGTVSALVGVLLALQQHDLKRLLAFHSVENIGIILIGAGLAMVLDTGRGTSQLATLALAAALLHSLNHAAFKGLLFLCAGSVITGTHERNMEELGGLARRMPWTAWLFLLGAVAISALPPLNGFVSEWMTFQALVLGGARLGGVSGLLAGVAASILALTGGLAATCFAKAFGVTFLGRPRSSHAEHAKESPAPMIAGMLLLASACVVLGVVPGYVIGLLDRPTSELLSGVGSSAVVIAHGPLVLTSRSAPVGLAATSISVTAVAVLFALIAMVAWALRSWPSGAARRLEPTWTCGMKPSSRFDYTATAFAKPLRLIFAALYRPRREVVTESGSSPYVITRLSYRGGRPCRNCVVRATQTRFEVGCRGDSRVQYRSYPRLCWVLASDANSHAADIRERVSREAFRAYRNRPDPGGSVGSHRAPGDRLRAKTQGAFAMPPRCGLVAAVQRFVEAAAQTNRAERHCESVLSCSTSAGFGRNRDKRYDVARAVGAKRSHRTAPG